MEGVYEFKFVVVVEIEFYCYGVFFLKELVFFILVFYDVFFVEGEFFGFEGVVVVNYVVEFV